MAKKRVYSKPPVQPLPGRQQFSNERSHGVMDFKLLYEILKEIMPNCPSYNAIVQATRRTEEKLRQLLNEFESGDFEREMRAATLDFRRVTFDEEVSQGLADGLPPGPTTRFGLY